MTYYAAVTGNDVISYREPLAAKTMNAAKREATKKLGGGYRHHSIVVGKLHDAGTDLERAEPLCTRSMASGAGWTKALGVEL